jgi:hypothetical protein
VYLWGQDDGINGCDDLVELIVCRQGGGCNGCDGLLDVSVWFRGYRQQLDMLESDKSAIITCVVMYT